VGIALLPLLSILSYPLVSIDHWLMNDPLGSGTFPRAPSENEKPLRERVLVRTRLETNEVAVLLGLLGTETLLLLYLALRWFAVGL
jgi:hypothetical protein